MSLPRTVEPPAGDLRLLVPESDVENPEVSIVVPALNEELTIAEFIAWCKEGLARAGVKGEILIIDSSSDRTPEIAVAQGARVLRTPKRGLGRAYTDSIPFIRGRSVIVGDADCTYDFRELGVFVERLREGYEFVMGSRFKGSIEAGAMPALHRFVGTPVTTWILNRVYSSKFSDIHCGMRALTRDALIRMNLHSESWEYASEMVLKSVRMKLRTAEVPISFYRDREGRVSHHKRSGWLSPWKAAWINLRAMFVNGADFFALKPGLLFLAIGLVTTVPLVFGPVTIGRITFSLFTMLISGLVTLLGLQSLFFGCLAQVLCDETGEARCRWRRVFPYTRTVVLSITSFLSGALLTVPLIVKYIEFGLTLPAGITTRNHLAVAGFLLMLAGFMTFAFTLVLHAALQNTGNGMTAHSETARAPG
jgi:glycosyltransferase involved in cell wall biosynthesis